MSKSALIAPKRFVHGMNRLMSDSFKIKLYTKTGDKGESSLFNGERRFKDDRIFNALGSVDELSSHIGMAISHSNDSDMIKRLLNIQCRLQDIGSHIGKYLYTLISFFF